MLTSSIPLLYISFKIQDSLKSLFFIGLLCDFSVSFFLFFSFFFFLAVFFSFCLLQNPLILLPCTVGMPQTKSTPSKVRNSSTKTPTKKKSPVKSTSPNGETGFFLFSNTSPQKDTKEPITYQKSSGGKKRKRKGAWDNRPIEEIFGDSDDDDDLDFESLANRELFQVDVEGGTTANKRRKRSFEKETKSQSKPKPKAKKSPSKVTRKSLPVENSMEKIRSHFDMIDQFDLSEETQTKEEPTAKPNDDGEPFHFLPLDKESAASYQEYQELTRKSGIRPLSLTRLSNTDRDGGGDAIKSAVTKTKSPAALKRAKEEEDRIKKHYQEIDNFSLAEE